MRYREGPTTRVSVDVPVPPERAWRHVVDLDLLVEASDELQHAEWVDPGGPFVGARFLGRNFREEAGSWETTSTVVECERPSRFAWAVGDTEEPAALWTFELLEAHGRTSLSQCVRLGPGPSGLTPMIEAEPQREHEFVAMRLDMLKVGMRATVDLIAARAVR